MSINIVNTGGSLRLPIHLHCNESIKLDLTYTSPYKDNLTTILQYREDNEYLYIPKSFNLNKYLPNCAPIDESVSVPVEFNHTSLPTHLHHRVLDKEAQGKFMVDMLEQVISKHTILCVAATGTGKTTVALRTAALLKQKTIVAVPTNALKLRWVEEIVSKLGIPESDIGIIQANKNTSEGKAITIAVLKTLAIRAIDNTIYRSFGLLILDEAHRVSTTFFSSVVSKFRSKYRIALTATPTRKDKADIILYNHFGKPSVVADTKAMGVTIVVKNYKVEGGLYGNDERVVLSSLMKNSPRNHMLAKSIIKAYSNGRKVIAVSPSVVQIQKIKFIIEKTLPKDIIGQFTATKKIGNKSIKVKESELKDALTKDIILATDGIIKEGVDVPSLDCGIDLAPFYNATQRVGRVRRYMPRQSPTILVNCNRYQYSYM